MPAPVLQTISILDSTLRLQYSEALSAVLPSLRRFVVTVNGMTVQLSGQAVLSSPNTITLRLASPVKAGQVVGLSYLRLNQPEQAGFGDIRSSSDNTAAIFLSKRIVTNQTLNKPIRLLITSNRTSLKAGDTAIISFRFSDIPTGFSASKISVSGGSISGFTITSDPKTYTAVFTPPANVSGSALVSVAAGSYTNSFATPGSAAISSPIVYDTLPPTLQISSNKSALKAGETATITFSFSKVPIGFIQSDITLNGGVISAFVATSNTTFTATFTPSTNSTGIATFSVTAGSYTDTAGNPGGAGATPAITFNTKVPTVAISSQKESLKAGDTATITFSFSEDPGSSFAWNGSNGDVVVSAGSLSAITGSGSTRSAIFTPSPGSSGSASISVVAGSYTNAAGNAGKAGTSPAIRFDTVPPTVSINSNTRALKAGETAIITFSFSEDPGSSFTWNGTSGDVLVSGGSLSAISGSGLLRSATFTPTASSSGIVRIIVPGGSYTDAAGNPGRAGATPFITYDTAAPFVTSIAYGSNDGNLANGEAITLLVTFSETVTVIGNPVIALNTGGSAFYTSGTGTTQLTFTYTPAPGQSTSDLATALSGALVGTIRDLAGNAVVASGFDNINPTGIVAVDTAAPFVTSIAYGSNDGNLANGEAITLLVTFSETVTVIGNP
ncbi:MAG: Ig-like domain-containing protein, partial [Cyanobium sp.]